MQTRGRESNASKKAVSLKQNESHEKKRMCKVSGCDSRGHLNGKSKTHFLRNCCPKYASLTPEKCVLIRSLLEKSGKMIKMDSNSILFDHQPLDGTRRLRNRDVHTNVNDMKNESPVFDEKTFAELKVMAADMFENEISSLKVPHNKQMVIIGDYEICAPIDYHDPEDIQLCPCIYFCEFCLKAFAFRVPFIRHLFKCYIRHPPGLEIYRKDNLTLFEIDGGSAKTYCKNLCVMARRFLNHKTVYYEVEPFMFYVLTEYSERAFHMVGYFSKMKTTERENNLSCLVVLPPYTGRGFGKLLIDFSYLMSKMESQIGSPERPLTDLGLATYRSYWTEKIFSFLANFKGSELNIKEITKETAIHPNDIVETLQFHGLVKSYKGRHIVMKNLSLINSCLKQKASKRKFDCFVDVSCFHWTPSSEDDIVEESCGTD